MDSRTDQYTSGVAAQQISIEAEPEVAYKDEEILLIARIEQPNDYDFEWSLSKEPPDPTLGDEKRYFADGSRNSARQSLKTADLLSGTYIVRVTAKRKKHSESAEQNQGAPDSQGGSNGPRAEKSVEVRRGVNLAQLAEQARNRGLPLAVHQPKATPDQELWERIRESSDRRTFDSYSRFINAVLCTGEYVGVSGVPEHNGRLRYYPHGVHGYELLKAATEAFVLVTCCCDLRKDQCLPNVKTGQKPVDIGDILRRCSRPQNLPYLDRIVTGLGLSFGSADKFPFCADSVRPGLCLIELIWSYWHEEGMLVQAINTISLRFQNRRIERNGRTALANFELDPLRPLNNLLWGYVQDEQSRLTVKRRAYEYDHEYGLKLVGKAVGDLQPADGRSKFLEIFHGLLHECARYFEDARNTLIVPDRFRLLNAIGPVHRVLAEGAHNQFGDLPSTARMEMLIQQWLLAQPPMREFLQTRAMVPYGEPWMGQVDALKQMMQWTDVSVSTFNQLAIDGEKILLSLRYGDWTGAGVGEDHAANWADDWKAEIQRYIQNYKSATGVDLGVERRAVSPAADLATPPSVHLAKRHQLQMKN